MRVFLVNWAKVWDGATVGGGVNGYAQALALELVELGHEVVWICGGTTSIRGEPLHIRRHPDWLGVRVLEFINSPVLAPSIVQFKSPEPEIQSAELERQFSELADWLQPDVVHFHNIEGFSAGCITELAQRPAAQRPALVYSIHNYHTICPQVYLLQGHRALCHDARGGEACVGCIQTPDPGVTRREREEAWEAPVGAPPRPLLSGLMQEFRSLAHRPEVAPKAPPGRVVRSAAEASEASSVAPESDERGRTQRILAERAAPARRIELPVVNTIVPDPSMGAPKNGYGRRRVAMIEALNACDSVLAVSEFVREKFISMGVEPGRITTQHIGTILNRLVESRRSLAFAPRPFHESASRPIRLVFMGVNHWYKGLPMMLEAMEQLEPDVLDRFHLSVYAQGAEQIEWMLRRLEPRLAGLHINYGYDQSDIPWILGGKDLGVVPSVWWDNAPQTVFEFFSCGVPVLGAAVGGITDFVRHGENGLLFRGNDREDLAARLREIAARPTLLDELRRNVRPPKEIREHAQELLAHYALCLDRRRSGPEAARSDSNGIPRGTIDKAAGESH